MFEIAGVHTSKHNTIKDGISMLGNLLFVVELVIALEPSVVHPSLMFSVR